MTTAKVLTEGRLLELPLKISAAEDSKMARDLARKEKGEEKAARAYATFVYLPPKPTLPREIPKKLESCTLEELYLLVGEPETIKKYKAPVEWVISFSFRL